MRRGGMGRGERHDAAAAPCFLFRGLRSGCDGRRECNLAIPAGEEYPRILGQKGIGVLMIVGIALLLGGLVGMRSLG